MEAVLKRTTRTDQKIASDSITYLKSISKKIKGSRKNSVEIQIADTGESIRIPKKALSLLFDILSNMAEGKSISLIPSDSEVSTQQAADMLNVSRPHLVKLLETGKIPFRKVGSHRRVLLQDLMTYEAALAEERERQLQFIAKQAQNLNLGYK